MTLAPDAAETTAGNGAALVLGWLAAVGIRLATGSATVATITAAGIVVPPVCVLLLDLVI